MKKRRHRNTKGHCAHALPAGGFPGGLFLAEYVRKGGTQRSDDFRPAVGALAVGPADRALTAATRRRYRAVPKGLTISDQPCAHWLLTLPTR